MKSVENIIPIETFIALDGDLKTLSPHNFVVDANFDLSVANQHTVPVLSVELGELKENYNTYTKKTEKTQFYVVTYMKNGKEVTRTVATYISVKCEMVLHHSFTK